MRTPELAWRKARARPGARPRRAGVFHSDAAARSAERAARRPAGPGVLGRVLTSPRRRRSVQYVSVSSPSPPPSLPPVQRPSSTPLTAGRVAWVYARRWLYLISFPRSLSDSPACPLRCHTGRGGSPSGPAAWAMRTMCVGCACVRAARVCALTETKVIGLKTWVCRGRVLALSCFHVESAHSQSSCLQQPRPLLDQRPVHS